MDDALKVSGLKPKRRAIEEGLRLKASATIAISAAR